MTTPETEAGQPQSIPLNVQVAMALGDVIGYMEPAGEVDGYESGHGPVFRHSVTGKLYQGLKYAGACHNRTPMIWGEPVPDYDRSPFASKHLIERYGLPCTKRYERGKWESCWWIRFGEIGPFHVHEDEETAVCIAFLAHVRAKKKEQERQA